MAKTTLKIIDPVGLYLTPANVLVSIANKYYSDITLYYLNNNANLKSIMAVISLGIPTNAIIEIEALGNDSKTFIKEVVSYIEKNDIGVVFEE